MRLSAAAITIALAALPAAANAPSPYSGQHMREVKALSVQEIDDLRLGRGMGLAKAAELNSYPGPAHVLELQRELGLNAQQIERTQALHRKMSAEARTLGEAILQREAGLDRLFRDGKASEAIVQRASIEIGELQGRLRAVHLNTHIEMKALLSAEQVAAYDRLRGYSSGPDSKGHGGHKH
jgi:hypothetical protein